MMKNHYLFWSIKRARNGGYLIHDDADQSDYIFADVGALCAWLAENLDPSDNVAVVTPYVEPPQPRGLAQSIIDKLEKTK